METYYSKHKDHILERQKKYNQDNKLKIKEYQRNYWYTVKKAKVQATRQPKPRKPRIPKPKKVKAPVLPSPESIIESIQSIEPAIESNIIYVNHPIIVSFD